MKVLLLNHFFRCGQSVHVEMLAKALAKRGYEVSVYFNNNFKYLKALTDTIEAFRIHIATLAEAGVTVLGSLPKPSQDTIIHAHSALTWRKGLELARESGCPFAITIHGKGLEGYLDVMQEADLVLSVAEVFASPYKSHVDKIVVLGNAVELDVHKPRKKNNNKTIVAYLGRYADSKHDGLVALSHAIKELRQEHHVEARIIGNIPRGIFGNVSYIRLMGWQTDRAKWLGDSDIVIGTGMAIREGMAAGNAGYVMGKYIDGIVEPDLLAPIPEFTGRESKIIPSSLVIYNDFSPLLKNREMLRQLQYRSYKFAKDHFDFEKFMEKIVELYESSFGHRKRTC
ncbi:MAG: glycosyltransferase family 4 protein [Firmicutes bacterium]|nr:glycosyltransferase family 4 protein [Bacillota bacterium]MDD4263068.1 glycosyltransferase family 4 protein [Bacillota bacterium]MDD4693298.1 glycosyltransferase family 4 protein [Bacillota bacterium]